MVPSDTRDDSDDPISVLEGHDGVSRVALPEGQVLVYREHLPPGVFVLLSGSVKAAGARERARSTGQGKRHLVVPSPEDLELPFAETLMTAEDSEFLFLPRTLVQSEPGIRRDIERL